VSLLQQHAETTRCNTLQHSKTRHALDQCQLQKERGRQILRVVAPRVFTLFVDGVVKVGGARHFLRRYQLLIQSGQFAAAWRETQEVQRL